MKTLNLFIIIFTLIGCTNNSSQKEFPWKEAVLDLQHEIEKIDDEDAKKNLLWQTQKILNKDTSYRHKLDPYTYDGLMSNIVVKEYLKHPLRQLNLTNLDEIDINDRIEAYKFRYWRAFSDEIVMITISKQLNGLSYLKSQVYKQDRNCNPIVGNKKVTGSCFEIKLNEAIQISDEKWNNFQTLIKQTKYWTQKEDISKPNEIMLDGSEWIIEGTKSILNSENTETQIYKKVIRQSPNENSSIYKIGKYLLDQNEYDWGKLY